MNSDFSSFGDEIFALQIEFILESYESSMQAEANAAIGMMLSRVDYLVATGDPITEKQLERAAAPLNDLLATELGQAMVESQPSLRDAAASQGAVVPVAPFFTAGTLMRQAEMDGTTMAEWFRTASASKWMQGLIGEVQKGIEAGWERHRSATEQASRRLAATAIETALWSHAAVTMLRNWTAKEFRYVCRLDERSCERCNSRHGEIFSNASKAPPSHPRCRCIAVPVQAG